MKSNRILFVALAVSVVLFINKEWQRRHEEPPSKEFSEVTTGSPVKRPRVAEEVSPSSAMKVTQAHPTAAKSVVPTEDEEEKFPTKDAFATAMKKKPLEQWLREATSLDHKMILGDTYLNIGGETGVLDTPDGQFQYRYQVGYMDKGFFAASCIGVTAPDGSVTSGVFGDGTLHVAKLDYQNAYVFSIRDKYFFVRYSDETESRSFDKERNEPKNPFNITGLLLYMRRSDKSIGLLGEVTRWIAPPDTFDYKDQSFCAHTFPVDPPR